MTRSFAPWATPHRRTTTNPEQHVTVRRGTDDYTTITIRQAGHQDWDTICDHTTAITTIADREPDLPRIASSVGPERGGTTTTTTLEDGRNAHLEREHAIAWLRERDRLIADLARLAQRAHIVDIPPVKSTKDELECCVKCGQDIDPESTDGKAKRVQGHPLHRNTCYHQIWRQAQTEKVDMAVIVNTLAAGIHT